MMRKRSGALKACAPFAARIAVALAVALAVPVGNGLSQIAIPTGAVSAEPHVKRALDRGYELEAQQRWGEALTHYEEAVREFPERRDLWDRLTRARAHYDLARRYEDASYLQSLTSLSEGSALDLYGEILAKIQSHYVDPPDWQELAERGLGNLKIALWQPAFRQTNTLQSSDDAIREFESSIRRRMDVTVVRTPQQAREVAANVARAASEQLGLPPVPAILEFACGATCSLDQYSAFLTGGQLDDTFNQIAGNFVGLGVELQTQHQALEIVNVIPGSPAEHGGLRRGDRIVEVDGVATDTISVDEAADRLKGIEGSTTELKLLDPGGATRRVRLVRRRVEVPCVENPHMVDTESGIAYVKLGNFQKTTARDLEAALWDLHRQGMQVLILDLRGNPGGLLSSAVEVADKFVSSGTIVSTRGRNSHEDFDYRAHSLGTWRVPLLVLIDADTASASEIFAGAIRDHGRGTIVGQRTYGKGSVQGIWPLKAGEAGVRLTTARFYSPGGQPISLRGISPDLVVQTVRRPSGNGSVDTEDATLQAAVLHAQNQRRARTEARAR